MSSQSFLRFFVDDQRALTSRPMSSPPPVEPRQHIRLNPWSKVCVRCNAGYGRSTCPQLQDLTWPLHEPYSHRL